METNNSKSTAILFPIIIKTNAAEMDKLNAIEITLPVKKVKTK